LRKRTVRSSIGWNSSGVVMPGLCRRIAQSRNTPLPVLCVSKLR
jgi:hypothetical protein